jgi:hypothetical protein
MRLKARINIRKRENGREAAPGKVTNSSKQTPKPAVKAAG